MLLFMHFEKAYKLLRQVILSKKHESIDLFYFYKLIKIKYRDMQTHFIYKQSC